MAKLKVLKTGETDINSTDIWRFSVHGDYPTQKIYEAGQTTLTILKGNTYGSKTISHSLGYAPIVMAMFEVSIGRFVKVLGATKAEKTAQIMQFFAVDPVNDYITGRVNDDHGGTTAVTLVSVNDKIKFTSGPRNSGVLPTPLSPSTDYYVKSIIDSNNFTISTTPGGTKVDITDGGGYYGDIFENVTNPYISTISGIYSIKPTDTDIIFGMDPILSTIPVGSDTDIAIYYMILYDDI